MTKNLPNKDALNENSIGIGRVNREMIRVHACVAATSATPICTSMDVGETRGMKRMAFLGGAALLLGLLTGCAGSYVGVEDYGYYNEPYYYPYYGSYYYDGGLYGHAHYGHGGGFHGGGHGGGHH